MNIANWIDRNATYSPDKVAVYFERQTLTYAELAERIEKAARMLSLTLGVKHGDRVSLLATNIPEYLIVFFACARIGAILNPLNWRLAIPELSYIVTNAESSVLLLEAEFVEFANHMHDEMPNCQLVGFDFTPEKGHNWTDLITNAPEAIPNSSGTLEDTLLLVYTSGTTGHPKGAMLSQNAHFWNAIQSIHMHDFTSKDVIMTCLPLFHVGGLNNQTTPALHAGASVVLHRRFEPTTALNGLSATEVTHPAPTVTCFVPAVQQACINSPLWHKTDFSNLRLLCVGSMLIPTHLSDEFRAVGVTVIEMYGCTETCPIAIYHRSDSDFGRIGSTGLVGIHSEAKIVDIDGNTLPAHTEGEVLIRGPHVMQGYWRNPEATAATLVDGWFRTGDIGHQDEAGYFYIKDRKKNMIISGGENIYAAEVERVLNEHPEIIECAIIGLRDETWGERPVAIVVANDADEATLASFMKDKLARFKLPRNYYFVDTLPKNALGKVQHFKLKQQFDS